MLVHASTVERAAAAAIRAGLTVEGRFEQVGVVAVSGPARAVAGLRRDRAVTHIEPNRPVELFLDRTHRATRGAEAAAGFSVTSGRRTFESAGVTGRGIGVAVIDSGADARHPMFMRNGKSKILRNLRTVNNSVVDATAAGDTDTPALGGHGTNVASIVAGYEATTGSGAKVVGAAPDASLYVLGSGAGINILNVATSLEWVLENRKAPCGAGVDASTCPPIRVVNNSWGTVGDHDPNSVVAKIVNRLVVAGVTVVFAHGNSGGDGSANQGNLHAQSPTPGVIAVANYDDGDTGSRSGKLNTSSSRGKKGQPQTWPDLAAPGTNILSACRVTMVLCAYGGGAPSDQTGNYYEVSGTSQAAPHVAGIVAQLLEADPALTPAEIEDILEDTAHQFSFGGQYEADPANPDHSSSFDKGHGLVDAVAAVSRARGFPSAPVADAECSAGSVAVDNENDAVQLAGQPTPMPSESSLDIVEARHSWDAGAGALTFELRVKDLASNPPGSTGTRWFFDLGGSEYWVDSERPSGVFRFGRVDPATGTTAALVPITGSYDVAADTVRITLTNADLAKARSAAPKVADLQPGSQLAVRLIQTQRRLTVNGSGAAPQADDVAGTCPIVLG